uniref:Putative secreted protein n=1 Tax=Anopheles darlingi TaxID=43151 RepID=A0A2M4D4V6_ANODA
MILLVGILTTASSTTGQFSFDARKTLLNLRTKHRFLFRTGTGRERIRKLPALLRPSLFPFQLRLFAGFLRFFGMFVLALTGRDGHFAQNLWDHRWNGG